MVDILLATYNGEKYIDEQLKSIINQSYKNWKLYIRDDGSKDNTCDIVEAYVNNYPDKIIFVKDNKKALGAKLNFGELMKLSKNEYCMFADQDDVWMDNKVSKTLEAMKKMESMHSNITPILVHTDVTVVDEKLKILNDSFFSFQNIDPKRNSLKHLILSNTVTGCTMMLNRALMDKIEYIPKECRMHDWWISLTASAIGKIYTINESTMLYRQHENNTCGVQKHSDEVNISRIKARLKNNIYKKIINDEYRLNIQQIKQFYNTYIDFLSCEDKAILKSFINLRNKSYLKRKTLIIKNGFFTGRIKEDIPLFIYL